MSKEASSVELSLCHSLILSKNTDDSGKEWLLYNKVISSKTTTRTMQPQNEPQSASWVWEDGTEELTQNSGRSILDPLKTSWRVLFFDTQNIKCYNLEVMNAYTIFLGIIL